MEKESLRMMIKKKERKGKESNGSEISNAMQCVLFRHTQRRQCRS